MEKKKAAGLITVAAVVAIALPTIAFANAAPALTQLDASSGQVVQEESVTAVNAAAVSTAPATQGAPGFVDVDGDGVCDNAGAGFIDANDDGVCDNAGNGNGGGFVDTNGDGVCDNFGNGGGYGSGNGVGNGGLGMGAGNGGYLDVDGDGVCDNAGSGAGKGNGYGNGRGAGC